MTTEEINTAAMGLQKPGVYYNVPEPVYRAIEAVSQSTLRNFAKCPLSFNRGLPEHSSDSLDFGSLFESILIFGDAGWKGDYAILSDEIKQQILEAAQARHNAKGPTKFSGNQTPARDFKKANPDVALTAEMKADLLKAAQELHESKGPDKFSNSLSDARQWHADMESKGIKVIDEIEITCAEIAVQRFRQEPNIARFLEWDAQWQVCLVWNDPDTGLLCKALVDWVPQGLPEPHRVLIDIKTSMAVLNRTPSQAAWKFRSSVLEFGYHWQAASYLFGWEQAHLQGGLPPDPRDGWCFAVAGNKKPWPAACYELDQDDIDSALDEYKEALKLWKRCHENDDWPGLTDDSVMMLPKLTKP